MGLVSIILVIILVFILFGALGSAPVWGHSANYGWGPSGGLLGLVLVIVLILFLLGRV